MSAKQLFTEALEDPTDKKFVITNDILAFVTILSIVAIVLETVPELAHWEFWFVLIEYVTVVIFTAEYVGRIYVARRKGRYIFSFFGLIDLISILPTFIAAGNLTFLKSARVLRILRFLRVIRLAKLSKTTGLADLEESSSVYWFNIGIYLSALVSVILLFGGLIYTVESPNPDFASIPLGMLWAAKVVLGGLGGSTIAQVPTTLFGEIIALLTRLCGLLLLGILIHVVGNILRALLFGKRKDAK